jgi:hypothetical protein
VERQHGSSEEAWTQVRCEEGRWQKEQGGPQRVGAQGRTHARAEQGSARRGAEKAQVADLGERLTEKPAPTPAFLHPWQAHLE